MRTSARTVAVVLFEELELLSLTGFVQVISLAGRQWNWRPFRIVTVASTPGDITTRNQLTIRARVDYSDCAAPELIFIPGGYGARRAATDGALLQWLKKSERSATHLLTVGAGAFPLAAAGLLAGQEVALQPDLTEWLVELEPAVKAVDTESVHQSERLLSVARPAASIDLGLQLVDSVLGHKQAATVAAQLGYRPSRVHAPELQLDILKTPDPA